MTKFKQCVAAVLLACSTQAFAVPTLSVNAMPNPATVGGNVDLAVMIAGITDLYSYQFTVSFDAALLKANGVTEGAFLGTGGTTFSDGGVIDNTTGTISYVFNTLVGPVPGVSGDGKLASISFGALGIGSAALSFSDVLFLDSNLNDIAVTFGNASVRIIDDAADVPEPASLLLFGAAIAAAGAARRRQRSARA
jgi:hypothetical protein